jgi:2-methylcitrate dehydratase PrpD
VARVQTIADRLAEFCLTLPSGSLPPDVVRQATLSTLDYFGVLLAAGANPPAQIVAEYVRSLGGPPQATVAGTPDKAPFQLAALANGARGHSIELDDHEAHSRSKVHPGAIVMPTALALSEAGPLSGADFLAAVVVGYDVIGRLSAATSYPDFLVKTKGFHTTPLFGVFAAAATAARLMGLSPDELSNAFGIAGSFASGLQETVNAGAMMKGFHAGWAAHGGIMAAQLAARGFTGPRTIFEGKKGFYHAFVGDADTALEVIDRDFGAEFDISLIMYKAYACGGRVHPTLTALDEIRKTGDIDAAAIEKVVVRTSPAVVESFAVPREIKVRPTSGPQAQFSLPYAVATLIVDGAALMEQFTDEAVRREDVLALAARVIVEADPSIESDDPEDEPASVSIYFADGSSRSADVRGGLGSLTVPMTDEQLIGKYRRLAGPVIGAEAVAALEQRVLLLASDPDVSDLMSALAGTGAGTGPAPTQQV